MKKPLSLLSLLLLPMLAFGQVSAPVTGTAPLPYATSTTPGIVQPGPSMSVGANGLINCSVGVTWNAATQQFLNNGTPIMNASFGSITFTQNPPPATGTVVPVFVNGAQTWMPYSGGGSTPGSTPITFSVLANPAVPGGQSTLNGSAVLYSVPIPAGTIVAAGAALRVTPPVPLPPAGGTNLTPTAGLVPVATWLKTQLAVYTPFHWKAYVLVASTATTAGIAIVEIDNWGNGTVNLPGGVWTLWLN